MVEHPFAAWIGNRVSLTGHFDVPVILEDVRPLGANGSAGYECRVRLPDGALEETIIGPDEAATLLGAEAARDIAAIRPVPADRLRLLVESGKRLSRPILPLCVI